MSRTTLSLASPSFLALTLLSFATTVAAQCLSDPSFEAVFNDNGAISLPQEGSCCQNDICALPCPEPVAKPAQGEK